MSFSALAYPCTCDPGVSRTGRIGGVSSFFLILFLPPLCRKISYRNRPIVDESIEECTQEMATKYNPCLAKDDAKTYLETYNCEYIKSPKPTRFERAMVSAIMRLLS